MSVSIVQELKYGYENGWMVRVNEESIGEVPVHIRVCLGCVTCDLPVMRRICGFLGHTARRGCSRCKKEFPTEAFSDKPVFDQDYWTL